MSIVGSDLLVPHVNPRPGVVKTLGICNVIFALLLGLCTFFWTFPFLVAISGPKQQVVVPINAPAKTGPRPMVTFNPFMGMDDPRFVRFTMIDAGTAFLLNGLMFVTGLGLINLRGWGARWWRYGAWTKIIRLWLFWGYYIVAIVPSLSETMGRSVAQAFQQSGMPAGRAPNPADLTRLYSIMNLITGVCIIGFGMIYPTISLLLLGRPGVKAALINKPAMEPELP